jgi:carboxypeptidase C (cathepsin A)
MAAAAAFHGKSGLFTRKTPLEKVLRDAESFATGDYSVLLAQGASMLAAKRSEILEHLAKLIGLPFALVERAEGRVSLEVFARELLRDDSKLCGRYDATITARDPFPDREGFPGPDPTLAGIEGVFTSGINKRLRSEVGVKTEREYHLLSHEVNKGWRLDMERHALQSQVGATDDLRYGMALNPHMKVFITHGNYDLVTPYYSTNRICNLMRLDKATAANLTVQHFGGGHMFYAWEASRVAFTRAIKAFYASALPVKK